VAKRAYIKYDEVEEDKEYMHHDTHDQLQLTDHAPGILQSVCQVLTLLVYLQRHKVWSSSILLQICGLLKMGWALHHLNAYI